MRFADIFWPASPRLPLSPRPPGWPPTPIGKGLAMYMQMGGNPGDGATLARQTGGRRPPRRSAST